MIRCPDCKKEITEKDIERGVCPYCGYRRGEATKSTQPKDKPVIQDEPTKPEKIQQEIKEEIKKWMRWLIIGSLAVIFLILIVWLIMILPLYLSLVIVLGLIYLILKLFNIFMES